MVKCPECGGLFFDSLNDESLRCMWCGKIFSPKTNSNNMDCSDDGIEICPMCGSVMTGGYCDDCDWIE